MNLVTGVPRGVWRSIFIAVVAGVVSHFIAKAIDRALTVKGLMVMTSIGVTLFQAFRFWP